MNDFNHDRMKFVLAIAPFLIVVPARANDKPRSSSIRRRISHIALPLHYPGPVSARAAASCTD
jgi:hypothetical protein